MGYEDPFEGLYGGDDMSGGSAGPNPFQNFGLTEADRQAAKKLAFMRAGMGVLAANKPGPYPQNTLSLLGQGGLQGMDAYQGDLRARMGEKSFESGMALNASKQKSLQDMTAARAAQQQSKEAQLAQEQERLNAFVATLPPEQQNAFRVNPPKFMEEFNKKFAPTKPDKPAGPQSDLGKLAEDRNMGRITPEEYAAKYKKLTAMPTPLVTVDNRQAGKFNDRVGTELGDQYAGLLKADMNAPATIAKYERLGSLLSNVSTGKYKGTILEMKAAAKSMGFDLTAMGVGDDVAPAQAARALSNNLALELRNPAGGAGMPGALSEKDLVFLKESIPSIENDPSAIGKMIEFRVKLAQREQKVAKMARAYRKKNNGEFDEGFYDELAEWSEKNPLFPEAQSKASPASPSKAGGLTPDETKELEALRKRFRQ
jgi:hypothetical protein